MDLSTKFSEVIYHLVGEELEDAEANISFWKQSAIDVSFKQSGPEI